MADDDVTPSRPLPVRSTRRLRRGAARGVGTVLALATSTAGCSAGDVSAPASSASTVAPATSSVAGEVKGMFDAGGHELYLRCHGEGAPTVVYFHGYDPRGTTSADSGRPVENRMPESLRYCAYDRRNIGRSDEVDGVGTGADAVADLEALLASAGIEPPYLLLGASWGGMVAYQYAATHPDDVVGMVLLDANFPGELALERFFPDPLTHEQYFEEAERFDQVAAYEEASSLPVPAIPVTYLLAMPFGWLQGNPGYDAAIRPAIEEYVAGFAPGVLREVESPHYMEGAVPDVIVAEVTAMAAETG